jgi:hypothetical protein
MRSNKKGRRGGDDLFTGMSHVRSRRSGIQRDGSHVTASRGEDQGRDERLSAADVTFLRSLAVALEQRLGRSTPAEIARLSGFSGPQLVRWLKARHQQAILAALEAA